MSKKDDISNMGQSIDKSPQKSLAIKGPPKIISEKLDIENYKGVKVTDINVRPITQSIAHLRAQKEMSSMHSNRDLAHSHSRGHSGLGNHSNSQGLHAMSHAGTENGSRILNAEHLEQHLNPNQPRTIASYLNDKITTFLMSEAATQIKQEIRVEGDLVTAFFDCLNSDFDQTLLAFLDEIKRDIELIMNILNNSANEMIVFFTYLLMMLKKMNTTDSSFVSVTHMIKGLTREINDEQQQIYQSEFNKFFIAHLLRNYCGIIIQSPTKRQPICELLYAHCKHDLQMRIKVVQSLKKHLKQDEVVYACHAFLIANEDTFNEQWFDVFLYYALIGLSNPKVSIRVYSLNVLNTIARHNAESILDITEKIFNVSSDNHWEIKTQCLEFAISVLSSYKDMSHLVDDVKGVKSSAVGTKPNSPTAAGVGGDRNSVKGNLNCAVDIIQNCFNMHAPKSVQKIGLFKLQPLLNYFKRIYPFYIETLVQTDEEIKQIILNQHPIAENEEILMSFGNSNF